MQEYYRYMGAYMAEALFGITMDAMGSDSDEDRVALQGIEFWSTVCDEELDLAADEESGAQVAFTDGTPTGSQHYARGALQQLAPRLLQLMERQEEHEDPSEWSVSKAACCCLDLLAQTVQDAVLEHVIPYVYPKHALQRTVHPSHVLRKSVPSLTRVLLAVLPALQVRAPESAACGMAKA